MVPQGALIGRDRVIADLEALVDGRIDAVVLEGESGIGKSALLGTAAAMALDRGRVVLRARADELEGARVLSLISDAAADVGDGRLGARIHALSVREMHTVNPTDSHAALRADDGLPAVVDDLLAVIERTSGEAGTLLVFDDLQWADSSSLRVLAAVAARSLPTDVRMALACRTEPRPAELARLLDRLASLSLAHHVLAPLEADEAAALLQARLDGEVPDALMVLAEGAGGNPYLLEELARAQLDGEIASTLDDLGAIPERLRRHTVARVRAFGVSAADVLQAAAVLGTSVHAEDLAAVTSLPVGEVVRALSAAVRAGLLVEAGDSLTFRHDLVRASLLEDLSAPLRRSLHREAARVLEENAAPDAVVARHILAGAEVGDARTVAHLRAVAARANRVVAAELLEQALELCRADDPQRPATEAEHAAALVWAGRPAEAEPVLRAALQRTHEPNVRYDLQASLSHALFALGRPGEASAAWAAASADPPRGTVAAVSVASAELALAELLAGNLAAASDHARVALEAEPCPARVASPASAVLAWTSAVAGEWDVATDLAADAVRLAEASGDRESLLYGPHLMAAVVADGIGDDAAVQAAIDAATRNVNDHGFVFHEPLLAAARAVHAWRAGRWDDALVDASTGFGAADETGVTLANNWLAAVSSLTLAERGDLPAASEVLDARATPSLLGADWVALARARVLESRGDPESACTLLAAVLEMATGTGAVSPVAVLGPDAARIASTTRDVNAIGRIRAARALVRGPAPEVVAASLAHIDALLDADAAGLEAAARRLTACGRLPEASYAWATAARAHAGLLDDSVVPEPGAARTAARQASALLGDLRAEGTADRLRSALREVGIRYRSGSPSAAKRDPASLTPSEERVVELVSQGFTNAGIAERLVVSRRTVESHLVRVYAKWGVRTRVELARRWQGLGASA